MSAQDEIESVIQQKYIKRPLGITCFAIGLFLWAAADVRYAWRGGDAIFFGALLAGTPYKVYWGFVIFVKALTAFGLYRLTRWGFFLFIGQFLFNTILLLANTVLTPTDVLHRTEWGEIVHIVTAYRLTTMVGSLFCIGLILIFLRYKKFFFSKENLKPL